MAIVSNYYQLYIDSVLQLAQTIVIKSQESAEGLNNRLQAYYGTGAVDEMAPSTWKYYLNIAGEYHPRDTRMSVTSMDTLQTIEFNKANLKIHRATARGYVFGTRQYQELVARFPEQEMLILGILYPVDIDQAIAAKDGSILGYPAQLIEKNEYSLVAKLQEWIDAYKLRWTNNQYAISDEYYSAVSLGILYLGLVPAILTLRLAACKTNEAHSYHVRQYLASHGLLDVYMDQLTLSQSLFLYRNIAYIERNNGQRNIFEWLVEHIMSERNLPIAEYVLRHNLADQPEEIYPSLVFRKNQLNLGYQPYDRTAISLAELMDKEDALARDNLREREYVEPKIDFSLTHSKSNVVLTKVLESSVVDYTNATPYTLEATLLNHWLWLAATGHYTLAVVVLNNPKTGERIPMPVKDAFVFMWYAFCRSIGVDLVNVPGLLAKRVQRVPLPTAAEIRKVADYRLVGLSVAEELVRAQPLLAPIVSTEAFYNKCVEINAAQQFQRRFVAAQEHQLVRGYVHGMIEQLYSDNLVHLAPANQSFATWFADRNIDITDFSVNELSSAWVRLMKDATGLSLQTTKSLRALQASMVGLLTQLSSYSVQLMAEINASDILVSDPPATRVGEILNFASSEEFLQTMRVELESMQSRPRHLFAYSVNGQEAEIGWHARPRQQEAVPGAIEVTFPNGINSTLTVRADTAAVGVRFVEDFQIVTADVVKLPGIKDFVVRTQDEKGSLRDIYRDNWPVWPPRGSSDLDAVITNLYLNGLYYLGSALDEGRSVIYLNGLKLPPAPV